MDAKIEHLKLIQTIITRMNTNSFMIKGWSITIVAAFLALYANSNNSKYIIISIIPTLLFWMLDSYYLQQERKFRGIYNDVAKLSSENDSIDIKLFEMPINKYNGGTYSYFSSLLSITLLPFYSILSLILLVIYIYS